MSKNALEFKFDSTGPKGNITMVVQFRETHDPAIYNLAFGHLLADGTIDDNVKNDNLDRNKILATIAATVYEFTALHPGKLIFFTGNTAAHTRLYRMALTNNMEDLGVDYEVFGVHLQHQSYWMEPFEKKKEYYGFIVKRK